LRLLLAAIAPIALLHPFAAVHAPVAVPVRAAIAHAGMAALRCGLAGLRRAVLHLAVLHLAMLHLAVLLMALVLLGLGSRARLSSGGKREDKRNRGDENLHVEIS